MNLLITGGCGHNENSKYSKIDNKIEAVSKKINNAISPKKKHL